MLNQDIKNINNRSFKGYCFSNYLEKLINLILIVLNTRLWLKIQIKKSYIWILTKILNNNKMIIIFLIQLMLNLNVGKYKGKKRINL